MRAQLVKSELDAGNMRSQLNKSELDSGVMKVRGFSYLHAVHVCGVSGLAMVVCIKHPGMVHTAKLRDLYPSFVACKYVMRATACRYPARNRFVRVPLVTNSQPHAHTQYCADVHQLCETVRSP